MIKKIIGLTLVIMLVSCFINVNYVKAGTTGLDNVVNEANDWISTGKNAFTTSGIDVNEISDIITPIAQALTVIGTGILLVVAAVMGIKWITANPEEQAKLKQQSIGLVVAAAVILGAHTIWAVTVKIVNTL